MKRLRENDSFSIRDAHPWLPVDCDISSPPCDDNDHCRYEWEHFLTLLQQWSFIVPSLERYTIDVWRERPHNRHTNQWMPVDIRVITKIHSLHWNDEGRLWCVIVSLHTIRPWTPEKRGALLGDGRDGGARSIWGIAIGEKTKDLKLLHQHYWFMIGDKRSDQYRAQHADQALQMGQMTVSSEWVYDTMPEHQQEQQSMDDTLIHQQQQPTTMFDVARQWWNRLIRNDIDASQPSATITLLVQDIQDTIWHLVLLLRYRDRWTSLCETAYMNHVVMLGKPISFPVSRPESTQDDGEVTVMLSLTRFLWDDKGPFAVCGHFCTFNTHVMGMKVAPPYTSMLGVWHEPICLYHVAADNTDCIQHSRRHHLEEQIGNPPSLSFPSSLPAHHHSLKYMFHRSAQWKPLGHLVPHQQHYLMNDIDAALMSVIIDPSDATVTK